MVRELMCNHLVQYQSYTHEKRDPYRVVSMEVCRVQYKPFCVFWELSQTGSQEYKTIIQVHNENETKEIFESNHTINLKNFVQMGAKKIRQYNYGSFVSKKNREAREY